MASASVTSSSAASATPASSPLSRVSSASVSSLAPSPADLADERANESIRAALTSGEKPTVLLDIAALRKTPDNRRRHAGRAFRCRRGGRRGRRRWSTTRSVSPAGSGGWLRRRSVSELLLTLCPCLSAAPPSDYLATKLEVFNGHMHPAHFPHVPDFGSMMKWNENYIHLTHKRIQQAKAILCVLASTHATLTHCPCLPDFACVLLIFFDERTTFQLLERIIVRSKDDEFYFTTNGHDFLEMPVEGERAARVRDRSRLTLLFSCFARDENLLHSPRAKERGAPLSHAQDAEAGLRESVPSLAQPLLHPVPAPCERCFASSTPSSTRETKSSSALHSAILKVHTKVLLACKSSHAFLVKLHSVMSTQTPTELMAAGFDIYLSRSSHMLKIKEQLHEKRHSMLANPPASVRTSSFHLPRFTREHDHVSELVSLQQLYSLWGWLPPAARIQDPILLYSSSIHGYNYGTMWRRACEAAVGDTPIFLLLQDSSNDQVIGLYLNHPLPNPPEIGNRRGSNNKSLLHRRDGHEPFRHDEFAAARPAVVSVRAQAVPGEL